MNIGWMTNLFKGVTAMPRPTNTQARRQQITLSLSRVMARSGYERATIAEVAREAGLTPGLLHYHFKNKREILMALVDHLAGRLETRYRARFERDTASPKQRLLAFLDALVATGPDADPDAMACWVVIAGEAIRQDDVRLVYQRVIARQKETLVELSGDLLASEGCPPESAPELALTLLCWVHGCYQLASAAPGSIPAGAASPLLHHLVDTMLTNSRGTPR
jgi:TetR/AcrR family transcriptional repressor of bet genes